jgi:hypothetical protein
MVFFIFVYVFTAKLRKNPISSNTLRTFETIIKQKETLIWSFVHFFVSLHTELKNYFHYEEDHHDTGYVLRYDRSNGAKLSGSRI